MGSLLISERGKVNRQYIYDQEKLLSSEQWPCLSTSFREIFSVTAILISLGVSSVPGWEIALLMLLKPYLHFHLCSIPDCPNWEPTGREVRITRISKDLLLIKCRLQSSVCIFLWNKSVKHKTLEAREDYLDSA